MNFDKVLIIGPSMEQRISKMAFTLKRYAHQVIVLAEERTVSKEFSNYIANVEFHKIPVNSKFKRVPIGSNRQQFIKNFISKSASDNQSVLIIARDVTYGYMVGKIINSLQLENIYFIVDIADNYDLFYSAVTNPLYRLATKMGFSFLTKKSIQHANGLLIVSSVNKNYLKNTYGILLVNKKLWLLRNLPIEFKYLSCSEKEKNSMVYVGKIDEISRDPFYILAKLKELPEYRLHFYSNQKESTIKKIKKYVAENALGGRVIFHNRVPYDRLAEEISKYELGIIPHKRNLLTDYTVPNKIYDYKSAGLVTIMSDNPSLIEENKEFSFGVIYSALKDDFIDKLQDAKNFKIDKSIKISTWNEAFCNILENLYIKEMS
jgi:hypothetical protein